MSKSTIAIAAAKSKSKNLVTASALLDFCPLDEPHFFTGAGIATLEHDALEAKEMPMSALSSPLFSKPFLLIRENMQTCF